MNYWQNVSAIAERQKEKGIQTYGQPLEQNQAVEVLARLDYIEEELVDALQYLEWLKDGLSRLQQTKSV